MILRPGTFLPDSHLCLPDSHLLTVQCSAIPASTVFINSDFPLLKKWPVFFFHLFPVPLILSTLSFMDLPTFYSRRRIITPIEKQKCSKAQALWSLPHCLSHELLSWSSVIITFFLTEYKLLLSHAQCSALAQTWKNHVHQQKSFLCSQKWIWQ